MISKKPAKKVPTTRRAESSKSTRLVILVGTRKGAWLVRGDAGRRQWRADGPHFLGHIINHLVLDPRDGETLIATASTGHLGPTIFRSSNFGKTWQEASGPPAFPKVPDGQLEAAGLPAKPSSYCPGCTTTDSTASGWVPSRTARPTGRSCTPS